MLRHVLRIGPEQAQDGGRLVDTRLFGTARVVPKLPGVSYEARHGTAATAARLLGAGVDLGPQDGPTKPSTT
jgi:hypothetical protein